MYIEIYIKRFGIFNKGVKYVKLASTEQMQGITLLSQTKFPELWIIQEIMFSSWDKYKDPR